MKKVSSILILTSLFAVLFLPVVVGAENVPIPSTLTSAQDLLNKIDSIGLWIFNGLLALAGVFLIVAGYYFVTGGSEPEKIKTARTMLINALIGVAVAALSKGLVAVIRSLVS